MQKITRVTFEEKNFGTTFSEWESDVTRLETALGKEIYEEIKIGLIIAGTTGKLREHLCIGLAESTLQNYEVLRRVILEYVRHQATTNNKRRRDQDAMDVDAIWNYKGDNRKGKGKYTDGQKGKQDYKGGSYGGQGYWNNNSQYQHNKGGNKGG